MRSGVAGILSALLLAGLLGGSPRHALSQELLNKVPVTVKADKLDYDRTTDVYVASGQVVIEQDGTRLEAEKVVLNNKTGDAMAEGKVILSDKGDITRAEKLQVNINTRAGILYKGNIFLKKDNLHLKGDVIERRSDTLYRIEQGILTTCDENEWYLQAKELNIDLDRYATGKGVSFKVKGVPVFYSPYFLFPVKRQSGFLIPEFGHSSKDGFEVGQSFFWAISDYKDMTISADYREQIGLGTGVEYRYANSSESAGKVYAKYWDLYHTSESRWEFRFKHQEEFAEDLSGRVDINLVSNEKYYYDLDKKLEMRSLPYLDSNAFYVERWNTASLYLLGQYSTDLTQSSGKTPQKVPEIKFTMFEEPFIGPLHLNFDGSAVNFTRQQGNGARRVDFNPQLSAPFGSSGLSATPRVGARATFYDRSVKSDDPNDTINTPTERKYVYAGLDMNARVSRVFGTDGAEGIGKIRHSIEPAVSYGYLPHVDQGNSPQFDSLDSVASMNTVTVSLINRLTAHYKESKDNPQFTTFDLMVFKLSQAYNLQREQNSMLRPRSDALGELYLKTPKRFSLTTSVSYNTDDQTMSSYSVGAGFTESLVTLDLTEQYLQDPKTNYLTGGLGLKLGKWNIGGRWWRDMNTKVTTQEKYSLYYKAQC